MFPELVFPNIFPLKTENIVPKIAHKTPYIIPSLYWNSVLNINKIQATITIPIKTSEISIFRLKIIGSKIEANKVDNERQLKAIETFETLME